MGKEVNGVSQRCQVFMELIGKDGELYHFGPIEEDWDDEEKKYVQDKKK